MAKADRQDEYEQLPLGARDTFTIAVTLGNPNDDSFYGFIPKTQLSWPTSAALLYYYLSRAIAASASRE